MTGQPPLMSERSEEAAIRMGGGKTNQGYWGVCQPGRCNTDWVLLCMPQGPCLQAVSLVGASSDLSLYLLSRLLTAFYRNFLLLRTTISYISGQVSTFYGLQTPTMIKDWLKNISRMTCRSKKNIWGETKFLFI